MSRMVLILYVIVATLCFGQGLAQNNPHLNNAAAAPVQKRAADENIAGARIVPHLRDVLKQGPEIAKRSVGGGGPAIVAAAPVQKRAAVDEDVAGARSVPHLRDILKRAASSDSQGEGEGSDEQPPFLPQGPPFAQPNAIVHRRSAGSDSQGEGEGSEEQPPLLPQGPPFAQPNAIVHRRSVDDQAVEMPVIHVVEKRQTEGSAHVVQKRAGDDSQAQDGGNEKGPLPQFPPPGLNNAIPHRRSVDDQAIGMPISHVIEKRQVGEISVDDWSTTTPRRRG